MGIAETSAPEAAEEFSEQLAAPAHLLCEQCGQAWVTVVVSWLSVDQCDRLCAGCYLATAMKLVEALTSDDPA